MTVDNHVSLWLGSNIPEANLKSLTQTSYSEDGDFEGSEMSRAFGVGFFNEACMEVKYFETPSKELSVLLEGFSSDTIMTPRFIGIAPELPKNYNAVILLYDLSYEGELGHWSVDRGTIDYIGSVAYV